jgi:hypothetical protein
MNTKLLGIFAAATFFALAGCNKAESPSEVQHDVAEAQQDANKNLTDEQVKQSEHVAEANQDAAQAEHEAGKEKAGSAYDVAVTRAEGQHKVAVEKCESLSGDPQKVCKEQADAALDAAKADAKAKYPERG